MDGGQGIAGGLGVATEDPRGDAAGGLDRAPAAGDLRRITGWVPPDELRHLLPRGTTRKRTRSVFMIAPLHAEGSELLDRALARRNGAFCWATDHI